MRSLNAPKGDIPAPTIDTCLPNRRFLDTVAMWISSLVDGCAIELSSSVALSGLMDRAVNRSGIIQSNRVKFLSYR